MLFGFDSKPLLFIDDHKTKIFKADIFPNDPMCADQNVGFGNLHPRSVRQRKNALSCRSSPMRS